MNKGDEVRVGSETCGGAEGRAIERRVERRRAQVCEQPAVGAGARALERVLHVDTGPHLQELAAPVAGPPPEPRAPACDEKAGTLTASGDALDAIRVSLMLRT